MYYWDSYKLFDSLVSKAKLNVGQDGTVYVQ